MRDELIFLIMDFVTSAFFSVLCLYILPQKLRQSKWWVMTFFFIVSFFMPVIGLVAVIIAVFLLRFVKVRARREEIKTVEMPFFMRQKIVKPQTFGESGAWTRAHSKTSQTSERIQSLAAINVSSTPQANILNRIMLQDDLDELRLYAFSLLNNQERELDEKINHAKELLEKTKDRLEAANIQKNLASLYWEVAYHKLVQEDLLEFTIEKALYFADLALEKLPEDATLWLLYGKIYMNHNEFDKAFDAFEKAKEYNAPDEKTLPYLAELCFKKKDFVRLREFLSASPNLWAIPRLNSLMRFWCYDYETTTS